LNTLAPMSGPPGDRLRTPGQLLAWLADRQLGAGALAALKASPPRAATLLREVHGLRSDVVAAVEALSQRRALPPEAVYGIDRVLSASAVRQRLRLVGGRADVVEEASPEDLVGLLSPLARSAAELLSVPDPRRVRRCAAADCAAWFMDSSKGGRRRWCSMTTCGNRAKAARHRRKRRIQADADA
jgi:predicted RNA-binding Zn ribbon-like protein